MAMKLLILAVAIALCTAELPKPEGKLIDPDFLFEHAVRYQALLSDLQADINVVIVEFQTVVSSVLKSSTGRTLQQYENHINDVEVVYLPILDDFKQLKESDCRNNAETILNASTTFTGFGASNCAKEYDDRVQIQIEAATKSLNGVDDVYSQVQLIVVKSFIGQNSFLTPERIQEIITEMYELVEGKWELSKPELAYIKETLAATISAHNSELGDCHNTNLENAVRLFAMFRSMVDVCIQFDNTPNPFKTKARSPLAEPDSFKQLFDKFETELAELNHYQWKTL